MKNRKRIAVIGSGTEAHPIFSVPLGQWLATQGYDLINGGGPGVMAETAKAFCSVKERKGMVIGILPARDPCDTPEKRRKYQAPEGYPNAFTDLCIHTHLPYSGIRGKELGSRNHIVVLSADFIVALPGSAGTRSEIELALEYGKPLVIVSPDGEWQEFADKTKVVKTIDEAIKQLQRDHKN